MKRPEKDGYAKGIVEEIGGLMMGKTVESMKEGRKEYLSLKKIEKERNIGYNQACDDWEAFLPSIKELRIIAQDILGSFDFALEVAQAISKRLRGK